MSEGKKWRLHVTGARHTGVTAFPELLRCSRTREEINAAWIPAVGRGNSREIEVYKAVTISPKRRPGALLWGPRAHWGCAVVLDC